MANPRLTVRELLPQTGATNVAAGGDSGDLGDFILDGSPAFQSDSPFKK